ncbi:barstar family protein [Streptomyces sp. NPDC090442]|uniref:barstar family protein n=1 Tax=Streptomyces sp. NPDC090442 TaxID=3365962 RepID=UPI0037F20ADC
MMVTVQENKDHHGRARYTLTDHHGRVWGVCAEVEGLYGQSGRETYELFGWVPEAAEVRGWVGSRVWLVPEDETLGPWLLQDTESLGPHPGTDGFVLTGLDDYEGPPEGYRGPVRLHNQRHWLGSCREFARLLPPEGTKPSLVLRGLAQGDRLRAALQKGTRRALDLSESGLTLEIGDDRGEPLTDRPLWTRISAWHPSAYGPDLIDLELDGALFSPLPEHARPLWERWQAGAPDALGDWVGLDTRRRWAWLDLVRGRGCRRTRHGQPAGRAYAFDGRHLTDEPGLYLALGEAVNGPGGYFGGCLAALDDCLAGGFGYHPPATLLWRNAATARAHLSQTLTPAGHPYDLFADVLAALAEGGMRVTLA